jgi:hypothetical protein
MIVACDTFDHGDFPVYVDEGQDAREVAKSYDNPDAMLRVMEVYDLRGDKAAQLAVARCLNYDSSPRAASPSEGFGSGRAVEVAAAELGLPREGMMLAGGGQDSWLLTSGSTGTLSRISLIVYRDEDAAEASCRASVADWLANGEFFDIMTPTRELLVAVAGACRLEDLRPWLIARDRSGWARHAGKVDRSTKRKTLAGILAERGQGAGRGNMVDVVLEALEGDLADSMALLVEQCDFDPDQLVRAVVAACGGWRGFVLGGMSVTSEDGVVVVAGDEAAAVYMARLHEESRRG